MPSVCQRRAWRALLALFLTLAPRGVLAQAGLAAASAASRFSNRHTWPTRAVVRSIPTAQFQFLRYTYSR